MLCDFAVAAQQKRQLVEAEDLFRKALAANPQHVPTLVRYVASHPGALRGSARYGALLMHGRNFERARLLFEKAVSVGGTDSDAARWNWRYPRGAQCGVGGAGALWTQRTKR